MSPGLAAMNDLAAAACPFAGAARLLEELAGVGLAVKRVERAALIAARKLALLPPSLLPDKLYAAVDGTGVPMTSRETAGRQGKGEDGRARTREVKLAVFFTQDELDEDGHPVHDRNSASVIASFEPAAAFGGLMKAEGIRRGADHVPPAHSPRRRRPLDLEHRHRQVPRSHPGRGPLPRPRAPARPRPQDRVHARRPQRRMARRPPRRPRPRLHSPACTGPSQEATPSPPCAAAKPAPSGKPSATLRTLRHAQPDQHEPKGDLGYLQN